MFNSKLMRIFCLLVCAVFSTSVFAQTATLRAVATGTQFPSARSLTFKQALSRSRHQMMASVTGVRLVLPNFFGVNPEAGLGGTTSVTASIEYPVGTFTQVTNGGSPTIAIADNSFAVTDMANVTIPAGAYFYVRMFYQSATGITYITYAAGPTAQDLVNGEALNYATSGLTDLTMGGTITNLNTLVMARPAAILGFSSVPAVFIVGDSRAFGHSDGYSNGITTTGEIARGVGTRFPYILSAQDGGSLSNWVTRANANQVAIAKYATHVINQYGTNDFYAGARTLAQMTNDSIAFLSYFPGMPAFKTTIGPETTSTDSWATVANQTVITGNTPRIAFNDMVRNNGLPGYAGWFDLADSYETSRDSGFYIVNGTALYATTDGIHQTPTMNAIIAGDDLFRPATIH